MDPTSKQILKEANIKLEKLYLQQQALEKASSKYNSKQAICRRMESRINNKINTTFVENGKIDSDFLFKLNSVLKSIRDASSFTSTKGNLIEVKEQFVQTEVFDAKKLEKSLKELEFENEGLKKTISEIKQEKDILHQQHEVLVKELKEKTELLEKEHTAKEDLSKSMDKLRERNFALTHEVDDLKLKLEELNMAREEYKKMRQIFKEGALKRDSLNRVSLDRAVNRFTFSDHSFNDKKIPTFDGSDNRLSVVDVHAPQINYPHIYSVLNCGLMKNIFKYLNVEDIANLKLSNSFMNDSIDRDTYLSNAFYMKIIKRKNDKIVQMTLQNSNYNINDEYNTNNEYIENLIKK